MTQMQRIITDLICVNPSDPCHLCAIILEDLRIRNPKSEISYIPLRSISLSIKEGILNVSFSLTSLPNSARLNHN